MTPTELEAMLLVAMTACACAVPGVFLVLRRLALIGDAMGHVVLFGIVAMYYIVGDLDSPWLVVGAVLSGVLTVALVEMLQKTNLLREDAAIGLVFPALFSLGTLIASLNFRDTHLDVDQVLLGHVEYASRTPIVTLWGLPIGRQPTVVLGGLVVVNMLLVAVFYKELKLTTFDAALAATFGFWPVLIHYGLMTAVSFTAVAAFDAVGPVLVVAFLVLPALTARMLTDRLRTMLLLSLVVAILGAVLGVRAAFFLRTNTAGMTAVMLGIVYGLAFLFAPKRGLVAQEWQRFRQRREFFATMLTIHLAQHEGTEAEADEAAVTGLHRHLHWSPSEVERVVRRAITAELVTLDGAMLKLTARGRTRAEQVFSEISQPRARSVSE
jgi:manganese/zinc/iron transport system permease protein